VAAARQYLVGALSELITGRRRAVQTEVRALRQMSPQARIDRQRQRVDDLVLVAGRTMSHRLALQRERLHGLQLHLAVLNPTATLARGYAIVHRRADNRLVMRVTQVSAGDRLSVQVSDGAFESTVN
jgi:exodeoxyribonuclease VII large subunit